MVRLYVYDIVSCRVIDARCGRKESHSPWDAHFEFREGSVGADGADGAQG